MQHQTIWPNRECRQEDFLLVHFRMFADELGHEIVVLRQIGQLVGAVLRWEGSTALRTVEVLVTATLPSTTPP